jgi:hypothetical protein
MIINLIDISKTSDIKEIIEKFRMKLNVNDDEYINMAWKRCAEIMAEDEKKAIKFIKQNCEYDGDNSKDYRWYIEELVDAYFEKTESKNFVKELWQFFCSSEEKTKNITDYINRLESIIYHNDWEEEPWV